MTPRDNPARSASAVGDELRGLEAAWRARLAELVCATGADQLGLEALAGALLSAASAPTADQEGWRRRGEVFFRRRVGRKPAARRGAGAEDQTHAGADAPA